MENVKEKGKEININSKDQDPINIEIKIIKSAKGVSFSVMTDDNGATANELIGMMEIAKASLINTEMSRANKPKMVDVVITQEDFDMDATGQLKKQGKKVGDVVSLPQPMVDMMLKIRGQMKKDK